VPTISRVARLLSNHGPFTSFQCNGAVGTFADLAARWPTGRATPYAERAVANRHRGESGLRIGEHTAWMILLAVGRRSRAARLDGVASDTYEWCTSPDRNVTVPGARPR
jgi:hypothetical protein